MHHGSSEEENSEEEARAQDSRGEEDDGEEDGYRPSQDRQEEIVAKRRGVSAPRLLYSPSKTISYENAPDPNGFAVDVCACRGCIVLSLRALHPLRLQTGPRTAPSIADDPGRNSIRGERYEFCPACRYQQLTLSDRARERQVIVKILLASRSPNDDG